MATKKDRMNDMAQQAAAGASSIVIEQPNVLGVTMEIAGTAGLIQNAFAQKALEQMLRKHMGLSVQREAKKPRDCVEAATLRNMAGRVCLPPTALKKAMLSAATAIKSLKKTQLRTQLFVEGQSIPIAFEEMKPRMDIVRTSGINRTPDVRFRPEFIGWSARARILFSDTLAVQTVVDLLNRAGRGGVGEWRPEKDGTFGTFRIARHITKPEEIAEVVRECSSPLVGLQIPDWAMDAEISPEILARMRDGKGAPGGGVDDEAEDEADEAAED